MRGQVIKKALPALLGALASSGKVLTGGSLLSTGFCWAEVPAAVGACCLYSTVFA